MEESKKKILLNLVDKIIEAGEIGAAKMRTLRMLNLKFIDRASKCTKDPNPLGTTMWLMNSKYPIAINKVSAKKYKVPSEYICPGRSGEDAHNHKLVLAKSEAIQWWMSQSEVPTEDNIKVSDILLKDSREECNKFYKINWGSSSIKWGQPVMERRVVRTKSPVFEVHQSLREPLLREILFPETTMPSQKIAKADIKQMREIMNLSLESKMTLSKQIRILINSMDNGERYLPVLPGSSQDTVSIKHCVNHTNFVLTNFQMEEGRNRSAYIEEIENIGLCCIFESKLSKIPIDEMKEILRVTTINGENSLTLIESVQQSQGIGTRWLKSLLSHSTTLERTYRKMTICPTPADGVQVDIFNTKNVQLKMNRISENNNFRFGDNRGTFVRSGTVIISISVNFTSLRDLKHTLATIGSYIGWEFQNTKGRTIAESEKEIYNRILESPHRVFIAQIKEC